MTGEKNLNKILKTLHPNLKEGAYVFCTVQDIKGLDFEKIYMTFKEEEGITVILQKEYADAQNLPYSYIASWITLTIHSALDAVGLTAAFSAALAQHHISCNVVAAFYHDHIFVAQNDAVKAIEVLKQLSN